MSPPKSSRKAAAGAAAAPPTAAPTAADRTPAGLPESVRLQHTHVTCGPDVNLNVGRGGVGADWLGWGRGRARRPPFLLFQPTTVTSALAYLALGIDNSWSLAQFKARLGVRITGPPGALADPDTLFFDVAGVDPSLANALRRILLAEVPTVAIESVFMVDNTSVIACEILAHRLGLVPLAVDPALLAPRAPGDPATAANTVVFSLKAACTRGADGSVIGDRVLSGDLAWRPSGSALPAETSTVFASDQGDLFAGGAPPAPVHGDILLAKLRPGQVVELEAHAVVGTGGDHAKWSPVATAWYRLQPELALTGEVKGADADALAAALPGLVAVSGTGPARVAILDAPARGQEHLLEAARRLAGEPRFAGAVEVRRVKDHFVFGVESTGALRPAVLVTRALDVLAAKCDALLERLG